MAFHPSCLLDCAALVLVDIFKSTTYFGVMLRLAMVPEANLDMIIGDYGYSR